MKGWSVYPAEPMALVLGTEQTSRRSLATVSTSSCGYLRLSQLILNFSISGCLDEALLVDYDTVDELLASEQKDRDSTKGLPSTCSDSAAHQLGSFPRYGPARRIIRREYCLIGRRPSESLVLVVGCKDARLAKSIADLEPKATECSPTDMRVGKTSERHRQ